MNRLAVACLLLVTACEKQPSKLDSAGGTGGGGTGAADSAGLRALEARVQALEASSKTKAQFAPDTTKDMPLAERMQRVEAVLGGHAEALDFLEKAWAQAKAQQEQQEAQEPDPNAVFAVDIKAPLAAGQVEGPTTAMITIIEAWDFA